jgi:hypothetical protein
MPSFQQLFLFLFALFASALAQGYSQESVSYDATVYVTSTVYRVNTVTLSGSPTGSVANSTSTISASIPTLAPSYPSSNGTASSIVYPSGTLAPSASKPVPSSPAFTGAASALNVNAFVAALAAGVGYLAL